MSKCIICNILSQSKSLMLDPYKNGLQLYSEEIDWCIWLIKGSACIYSKLEKKKKHFYREFVILFSQEENYLNSEKL